MATFTQPHSTDVVTAGTMPALASGKESSPPVPNENIDPTATADTSPPSPQKRSSPSTPNSTRLHRRFLHEVTMSPQTPIRSRRESPTKGRESPAKGRESPSKQKLEIGQNGFYFSCELPMSKVTPKKSGTPSRDAGTPTRRTPSPLKKEPVKQSPARALFGTPKRKTGTPAKGGAETPIKPAPKAITNAPSAPTATPRVPPECLKAVTKEGVEIAMAATPAITTSIDTARTVGKVRTSLSSHPSNIGHLMAGLGSTGAHNARDLATAECVGETNVSPAPTPLRRASEKLQLAASPSFRKITITRATSTLDSEPDIEPRVSQAPILGLPLSNARKNHENKLSDVTSPGISAEHTSTVLTAMQKTEQDSTEDVFPATQLTRASPETKSEAHTALARARKEQALHYPPLLFPKPEPETTRNEQGLKPEKHVKWQETGSSRRTSTRSGVTGQQSCVGTDPSVLLAMKKEMVLVEASVRASAGQEYFHQGPLNTNELPAMSNTLLNADQDASKPEVVNKSEEFRVLTRTHRNASSIGTVRTGMVISVPKRAATPSVTKTPSRPPVRDTGARQTPLATPTKSKIGGTSMPRGARKSVFDSPAPTRSTPASKPPVSIRKPLYTTPRPTATRKSDHPATPKPYDPSTDRRPYKEKFVSALDIADKIAEWNSEDRKKAALALPIPTFAAKTLSTPTNKTGAKEISSNGSFTPEGSPTKLPSPIKHPKLRPQTKLAAAPKTPQPKKTAASRMRERGVLRTPVNSRGGVLDRNALRTPSKAIVSSLDKAIDREIDKYAKEGREFTPGGNRIQDLLEARQRNGS